MKYLAIIGVALTLFGCGANRTKEKICFNSGYSYRRVGEKEFIQIDKCFMPNGDIKWEQSRMFHLGGVIK